MNKLAYVISYSVSLPRTFLLESVQAKGVSSESKFKIPAWDMRLASKTEKELYYKDTYNIVEVC